MKKKKLIVFDMDGVLIDSETIIAGVQAEVLTELGYPCEPHDMHELFVGKATPATLAIVGELIGEDKVQTFVDRAWPLFAERMKANLQHVPGIPRVLDSVKSAGRKTCVASNSQQVHMHLCLEKTGLAGYFDKSLRFSGRDMPKPKPAPDLHLHCLQHFGVSADRALVLEDSLAGALGAVAAGVPFWGFVGVHPAPEKQAAAMLEAGAERILYDWSEFELPQL